MSVNIYPIFEKMVHEDLSTFRETTPKHGFIFGTWNQMQGWSDS